MAPNIDAAAAEADAFGFQAEALFECGVSAQLDLSTRAEYSVPWQSDSLAQGGSCLTRSSRQTCSFGNRAISRNHTAGNLLNDGDDLCAVNRCARFAPQFVQWVRSSSQESFRHL